MCSSCSTPPAEPVVRTWVIILPGEDENGIEGWREVGLVPNSTEVAALAIAKERFGPLAEVVA